MAMPTLTLEPIDGEFAVARLALDAAVPTWAAGDGRLSAVIRTSTELTIVTDSRSVPTTIAAERGWVAFRVAGTLDLNLIGILSTLTTALAAARVPVFALSTFETDLLLVRAGHAARAVDALDAVADVSAIRERFRS